ncbi:MAG: hypothetical protein KF708_17870 [Pirellulales bacterium]|nr:hypothetical protein [Pirellulales bacterium]
MKPTTNTAAPPSFAIAHHLRAFGVRARLLALLLHAGLCGLFLAADARANHVTPDETTPIDVSGDVDAFRVPLVSTAEDDPCDESLTAIARVCHEHDVWLVSSRRASRCGDPEIGYERLDYWHAEDGCHWTRATAEEFHVADNPRVPTIFFVHGNRADFGEAQQMGWQWVRRFERGDYGDGPARLVIYTWPSDAIPGKPIEDARIKAGTSESYAWYLAALVDRLAPEVPVGLVGYSYGARLITASLHLMGGGRIAGRQLTPTPAADGRPVRAVLIAAALDHHWLGVGQHHGMALSQVESLVVFVNGEDPVLRLYPHLYGHGRGPEALGRTGVASRTRLGEHGAKLWQVNVTGAIGRHHDWTHHVNSGAVMGRARREFSFDDLRDRTPAESDDPPPALPMASSGRSRHAAAAR